MEYTVEKRLFDTLAHPADILHHIARTSNQSRDGFYYTAKGDALRLESELKDSDGKPLIVEEYEYVEARPSASSNYAVVTLVKMGGYNNSAECAQEENG